MSDAPAIDAIIYAIIFAVLAIIYAKGAKANGKNRFAWSCIGISIFVLCLVLVGLPLYLRGPSSADSLISRFTPFIMIGLPLTVAIVAKVKLLPGPPLISRFFPLNETQKKIVLGIAIVLFLMTMFPPIDVERRFTGFTDGTHNYTMVDRNFTGWGFIGQENLVVVEESKFKPKDPDNPTFWERLQMIEPIQSFEEMNKGKKKVAYRILGIEFVVSLALAGAALFLTRTKAGTA